MKRLALIIALILPLNAFAIDFNNIDKNITDDGIALTVLGKEISKLDLGSNPEKAIQGVILRPLFKQFADDNNILVTDAEANDAKDFFNTAIDKALRKKRDNVIKQFEMPESFILEQIIKWKIDKILFDKFGGRVIFQQAGAEPVDAYRDFLKEQEEQKKFTIHDKNLKKVFWSYFNNETMHDYYSTEVGNEIMSKPIWEHSKNF